MPSDPSRLTSRLRELLRSTPAPAGARDSAAPLGAVGPEVEQRRELTYELEGAAAAAGGVERGCVVLERHYDLELAHGREPVAQYGEALARCLPALAVLAADERA
ncbi:MAG: hypothetical protein H6Q09_1353, partial [Acidobacteria bacterium]|nr:hypothetical protein [Acidobacteriota bacterium]